MIRRASRDRRLWLPVLLFLSALGGAALQARAQMLGFPFGDLKEVTLQGKLISLGEVLPRKYGTGPTVGAEPQWALALPEGQLYSFLETDTYRKLVDPKLKGQAVEIKGRLIPRSQLLEIVALSSAPEQSIRRRFFCETCNIYAMDWGPCVCCGKEFVVVKPGK